MNILFFLTHKANCTYIYDGFTIRQALERLEHGGRFATIPILKLHRRICGDDFRGRPAVGH